MREHARQGRQLHRLEQGEGRQEGHHPLSLDDFYAELLEAARLPPGPPLGAGDWLASLPPELARREPSFERAVFGATRAALPAHAVAAGHQAALRALFPALPRDGIVAFCASEEQGAHPRWIRASLERDSSGALRLDGQKRWATLAPSARTLLVVASLGRDGERNRLGVARVPAAREGVRIEPMPPGGFLPELEHAVVTFRGVAVEPDELLPIDGYEQAVKPFRTIEDLHVAAAMVAFSFAVGVRAGWPRGALERSLALLAGARSLAGAPLASAGAQLALAGWLGEVRRARRLDEAHWRVVAPELAAAWRRDTAREVAAGARELRRARAWQRLGG